MNPKQFRLIAKAMQEFGISHVKIEGMEITRRVAEMIGAQQESNGLVNLQVSRETASKLISPDAPIPESNPIEHKIEQMTSLMKMSDVELVDSLFPDHTQDEEESA